MPEESNNIINEHKENPKETKIYSKEQKLKELLIEGISEETTEWEGKLSQMERQKCKKW